jgi:hypothetical protein
VKGIRSYASGITAYSTASIIEWRLEFHKERRSTCGPYQNVLCLKPPFLYFEKIKGSV